MAMVIFFSPICQKCHFFHFAFPKKDVHDNSASKKDYPENRETTSLKRILVMTSAKNFSKAQEPKDIFKTTRGKKFQNAKFQIKVSLQ